MKIGDFLAFRKLVAPILIKILFWVGLAVIVLETVNFCDFYTTDFTIAGDGTVIGSTRSFNFLYLLLALVADIVAILIWRVICEIWIVIFSINDRLGTLVELKKAEKK